MVHVGICHTVTCTFKNAADLVNELVDDVPQPLVWQLQRCRAVSICLHTKTFSQNSSLDCYSTLEYAMERDSAIFMKKLTENVVEEVAVVVVRLKPLVQSWSTLIIKRDDIFNPVLQSFFYF